MRTRLPILLVVALLAGATLADAQSANNTTTNGTIRRGQFRERDGGGGLWPQLSMVGMIAALVFVPLNFWRRVFLPRALAAGKAGAQELKDAGAWLKKSGVNLHMIFGAATLVIGTVHGLTEQRGNWELWGGMVGLGILLLMGTVIHWRWVPPLARQRTAMFAVKWAITALSLALLLYGHSLTHPAFRTRPPIG